MRIAVASGKGGTGKTTVATNLAYVASLDGQSVAYVDCDVEEPNGHLFLKPEITSRSPVARQVPEVDPAKCTLCGLCGEICQYSAIVPVGQTVLVYPELCHACGGCVLVCPSGAIAEQPREIGRLETGRAGAIHFVHGLLNIGEAMSPPLIRQVKQAAPDADIVLIDAPPGTSCPVIESVRGADYVLLVTEPTPFGLHDLKLAVEMVRALKMAFGVVINRAGMGDNETATYCRANRIEIIEEIPDDRRIAEAYSRGVMMCEALPEYRSLFEKLFTAMTKERKRRVG
ncbi:MAG: ATP-binding protein [Phycisphaerae bacterium]|nr:ATP-binding protein [Phycisphaerae bacterium]